MKKLFVISLISVLAACASFKPLAPAQSDADRATKKFPGTTLADLTEGKSIFETKCHKCHSLKKPFSKSEDTIAKALPRMAKRANIDSKQQDLVLKYLLTMNSVQNKK